MTAIIEQLDLAGWDTAWLHETRGHGGEWVKGLPGGMEQPTFPGMPASAAGPPDLEHQLETDIASGVAEKQSPKERAAKAGLNPNAFGKSAQTSVITFSNGHQWVSKRGLSLDEMHREVLVSRISDVLGAGAPHVILRDDPQGNHVMWQPLVPDATSAAAMPGVIDAYIHNKDAVPDPRMNAMINSRQGAKIGILDTITDNGDRHPGNWMVRHDAATGEDEPVPIDHGLAQMDVPDMPDYGGSGPFGENLFGNGVESVLLAGIPKEAWASWQNGVRALAPQFKEYGISYELRNVQQALRRAAQMSAAGKREAPHTLGHAITPDDPKLWIGAPS